jgi:copper chaperone CopZ/thiol-disulfide isomerase/thioredoxin
VPERATKTIPIKRMDCPTCIPLLEREVKQLDGVDEVRGNYLNKTLKVTYDGNRVPLAAIEAAIERLGYQIAYKKYPGVVARLRGLFRGATADGVRPLTDTDFSGKVFHAAKPVAVLFSSPTCPTCYVFKTQFRELVREVGGAADFYEMDIASTETWRNYDVLSIPSVLVFREGALAARFDALPAVNEIRRALIAEA